MCATLVATVDMGARHTSCACRLVHTTHRYTLHYHLFIPCWYEQVARCLPDPWCEHMYCTYVDRCVHTMQMPWQCTCTHRCVYPPQTLWTFTCLCLCTYSQGWVHTTHLRYLFSTYTCPQWCLVCTHTTDICIPGIHALIFSLPEHNLYVNHQIQINSRCLLRLHCVNNTSII